MEELKLRRVRNYGYDRHSQSGVVTIPQHGSGLCKTGEDGYLRRRQRKIYFDFTDQVKESKKDVRFALSMSRLYKCAVGWQDMKVIDAA